MADNIHEDMSKMDTDVTISMTEYDELIRRSDILAALEAGGVDNWTWYGESLRQYFKEEDEDDN